MTHTPAALTALLLFAFSIPAQSTLRQRIEERHVWNRLARDGNTRYLMVATPSRFEREEAKRLGVPAEAADGTVLAFGKPISFPRPGDTGGARLGAGIVNPGAADGIFHFEVGGGDTSLAWGDFDGKHPEAGVRPFGTVSEWQRAGQTYRNTFRTGEPFGIYLRVKQSLPESTWKIVTGPNPNLNDVKPGAAPGQTAAFKLIGTGWQTIPIIYQDTVRDAKGKPATLLPFGGFAVYPGGKGNRVQLAWIRVTDPRRHVYARRTVELPAAARDASLTLSCWDSEVYVNGQRAAERTYPLSSMGPRRVELTRFLKPGKNVIAIHEWCDYGELAVTGGITCTDGTFVPLFSWLPFKREKGHWVRDPARDHFALHSPLASPWKTASLAFSPGDTARFMNLDYDDSDWGELSALETSGRYYGNGPPYFGLISVETPPAEKIVFRNAPADQPRLHPIFSPREPVELRLQALRLAPKPIPLRLSYILTDKQTGKNIEETEVKLDAQNVGVFVKRDLPIGPYELHLKLTHAGKPLDERWYEFLVAGPLPQPAVESDDILSGLKRKEILSIDCSAEPKPGEYGAFRGWEGKGAPYNAPVRETPFGKFRETGPNNADCFSYRATIANPGRPHLLEIVYPDDRFRVQSFYYTEPRETRDGTNGINRCSVAVLSGWPDAPSKTMRTAHGIFWPVQKTGTIDVFTTRYSPKHPEAPAAASRIRVYEIEGELPRLAVRDFPGQFKPFGVHTERGVVLFPSCYGGKNNAGDAYYSSMHDRPDFYADWYSTSANFVRLLRFHGQNFYIAGQHMYGGTNFPSKFNDNDNGSGGETIQSQRDWAGILAAVMGENDCGFVSSFECVNNSAIIARGTPSARQLAAGLKTLVQVSHQGKPYPHGPGITVPSPLPSWTHPEVQQMLLEEVDELIALYKEYPAWKGINFLLNTLCGPSYGELGGDPLKLGYEDAAAERFEKETGRKFPIAANDPERFRKRYEHVLADERFRAAWIDWRCAVLLELNRKIRDRLLKVRPDCKLYLNLCYPYRGRDEKLALAKEPEKLRRHIMQFGWDPRAYQKEPGMVVYTMTHADAEKRVAMSGKREESALERQQGLSEGYLNLFTNDGKGGVDLHTIFTENWPLAEPGKWLWSGNGAWVGYHWPSGHAFDDFWTNSLIRTNPTLTAYNWHDSNLDSRLEPGLRRYARAWRALPNGRYEVLTCKGLDGKLSLQRCRDHPEYCYLANPGSARVSVELAFTGGAKVTHLLDGKAVTLTGGTWRLDLGPYAVLPFRVENGEMRLR